MRVRAKAIKGQKYSGYSGLVRRRAGDVFDLADPKHFSSTWMEKVDEGESKTPAPGEATPVELGYETAGPAHRGPGRPKTAR